MGVRVSHPFCMNVLLEQEDAKNDNPDPVDAFLASKPVLAFGVGRQQTGGLCLSHFLWSPLCVCILMNHLSVENVGRILSEAFVRQH